MAGWRQTLLLFRDPRMLVILLLGFSSGLPLALTSSTLNARLTESGVSLTGIGLFSLVALPYSLKFLWAPLIDQIPLPKLNRLFGHRRAWMLCVQLLLMASILGIGLTDPLTYPLLTVIFALLTTFFSASQDVVIDAYRVEILDTEEQGAGATMVQIGYRIAMLISSAGALYLAEYSTWGMTYVVMAALIGVGMTTILCSKEPALTPVVAPDRPQGFAAWTRHAVVGPFTDMAQRQGWRLLLLIILFALFYKLADAMLGVMATTFYLKIGFTKPEIANITKIFGFFATLVGFAAGGLAITRLGIMRSLVIGAVLQGASNLMFAWQASVGANTDALALTIAVENFTGSIGSTAFVAYISGLCSRTYTGTQYALLSALAAVGRSVLAAPSGWLAEKLGWVDFFIVSTFAAVPGLIVLLIMIRFYPPDRKVEEES